MTICWGLKNSLMLQDEDGHEAEGVPQVLGSTVFPPLETSAGMLFLCYL